MAKKKKKKKQLNNPGHGHNHHLKSSIKKMSAKAKLSTDNESNPLYRQNLAILKKRYPELTARIKETSIKKYQLVPAEQGHAPNLFIKELNRTYYNPVHPMDDVKEQLENLELKNNRLAIGLGFGLGYELLYYAHNMVKKQRTSFMLIIEKDLEIFKSAMHAIDLKFAINNEKLHLMVGIPEEKLYVELRNYLADNNRFKFLRAMKPFYHHSALMLNKDYYLNALKHLRESGAHQVLNYGNCPEDSLIGVENMLANIDEIISNPGINLLYNKFKGRPAVIVSTGPSLNKNKHLLKYIQEKALIIAADASLKVLMDLGVKPHLVTSLERVPGVVKLMSGFNSEEVKDVYFSACPVILNDVYKAYPGPRIVVYRNFDHFRWLGVDKGILDIKLSAGNMAFKIAEVLGCDPIVLIGQDLAFSEDGRTHASGSSHGEKKEKEYKKKKLMVKGNYEKQILTTNTWYSFLKAYELDLASYQGTCINSTEGGAYIEGTRVMPFKETIEKYICYDYKPLDMIKDSLSRFSSEDIEHNYRGVKLKLEKAIKDMQEIVKQCNEGLTLYDKNKEQLIALLSHSSDEEKRAVTDRLYQETIKPKNNVIINHQETFQLLLMHVIQSFNIKFEMELIAIPEKHNHENDALLEIALKNGEWYSVVGELSQIVLNLLVKSLEVLDHSQQNTKKKSLIQAR